MDKHDNKNTCMACSCPCEMHKEHNHPIEGADEHEKHHEESKSCSTCGTKHKEDGAPACGCN